MTRHCLSYAGGKADVPISALQQSIDQQKERIVLSNPGSADSLTLPSHTPSYTFYAHSTGIGTPQAYCL